jgi:hypothetical protein
MFISPLQIDEYNNGRVVWGISEEALKDYPYKRVPVSVPASEVINAEVKEMPIYDDATNRKIGSYTFVSYDIQKKGGEQNANKDD